MSHDAQIAQLMAMSGLADPQVAAFFLESAGNDLNAALNMALDNNGAPPPKRKTEAIDLDEEEMEQVPQGQAEDGVRAPIKPTFQRLLDPLMHEHRRPRRREGGGVFESLADFQPDDPTFIIGGSRPGGARIAELFKPPINIMERSSLAAATIKATEQGRFLLLSIQKPDDFDSLRLNRDTWSLLALQQLIQSRFVFWQGPSDNPGARDYLKYYEVHGFPHIALLDPRTGERLDFWDGFVGADQLRLRLLQFLERHPWDASAPPSAPASRPVPLLLDSDDMKDEEGEEDEPLDPDEADGEADWEDLSEDAQLERAIKLSMKPHVDLTRDEAPSTLKRKREAAPDNDSLPSKRINFGSAPPPSLPLPAPVSPLTPTPNLAPVTSPAVTLSSATPFLPAPFVLPVVVPGDKAALLQLRLPDSSLLKLQLPVTAPLSTVFAFVRDAHPTLRSRKFELVLAYPRRRFTEAEGALSVEVAGLTPRAALNVEADS